MAVVCVMSGLSACEIAQTDYVTGPEKTALMQVYRNQSTNVARQRARKEAATIRQLKVTKGRTPEQTKLSVDLADVSLSRVVPAIISRAGIDYKADSLRFGGRVSATFSNVNLVDGLDLLLERSGTYVTVENGILLFKTGGRIDAVAVDANSDSGAARTDSGASRISQEYNLRHLTSSEAVTLVSDLFDGGDSLLPLTVSSIEELNALFVSGTPADVSEALGVLNRADRPVAHVIIEALVVDFDVTSYEEISNSITDAASGRFSAIDLIPGLQGGNIVATFNELATNADQLTATISLLASQDIVQVLARPYISTRSTRPASIAIVDDQFVLIDSTDSSASVTTTDSVAAGITLQVTPLVTADNSIRMDVTVEDSRYTTLIGDALIAKERNSASTSMTVASGQTIVIGGLNSKQRSTTGSGLPFLRKIPGFSALAGEQSALESQKELVVYLTPYVWIPGIDTPLPFPGTPQINPEEGVSIERVRYQPPPPEHVIHAGR